SEESSTSAQNEMLAQDTDDATQKVSAPAQAGSTDDVVDHEEPLNFKTFVFSSTAMQNLAFTHETEGRPWLAIWAGADHDVPLKIVASPPTSTATQNETFGHDTSGALLAFVIWTGADHELPSNRSAFPWTSTPTQKVAVAHETEKNHSSGPTRAGPDHDFTP